MNKVCIWILNYHLENKFKTELFHWKRNWDIINCKNIILKSVGGKGKSSQTGTINFAFLWNMAYHRLDHICPEYGKPGTISLYGPEYDQPGNILWVWWQSMIDLVLYRRESRDILVMKKSQPLYLLSPLKRLLWSNSRSKSWSNCVIFLVQTGNLSSFQVNFRYQKKI